MCACGQLNVSGFHSAAVTLLRPLEDALDCFAAVTMVKDAAERWSSRQLKPSDAAKLWTKEADGLIDPVHTTLSEYRKVLRGQFAHYMHCSYDLCLWDLYFQPHSRDVSTGQISGTYEINRGGRVIDSNGHAIDAHLMAHHLEFMTILKHAYARDLGNDAVRSEKLSRLERDIVRIMEEHNEHECQNVLVPPEWQRGNK